MAAMRGPLVSVLSRPAWWWIFGLFIALPALVLALLGLRAMRIEDEERAIDTARQHAQLAALVDAALTTAFDRLSSGGAPAEADPFEVDARGVIVFPRDRVFSGPHGLYPTASSFVSDDNAAVSDVVLRAQSAHARRRLNDARLLYGIAAEHASLRAWATLHQHIVRVEQGDPAALDEVADARWATSDARSPAGVPLALLAASWHDVAGARGAARFLPLLRETHRSLLAGRWWLSVEARRVYDGELRGWLGAAGAAPESVPADDRAQRVVSIIAALQSALTRHLVGDRAVVLRPDGRHLLALWRTGEDASEPRQGFIVDGATLMTLFDGALGPLVREQTVRFRLHDESGATIWGPPSSTDDLSLTPLTSTSGLTLTVDAAVSPADLRWRRIRNYALVIVPVVVLACGLVMTAWMARRELALARQQSAFVASMTHEFKSPLTGIRLLMERLTSSRGASAEGPARYYAAIDAETARLEGLVNRLLEAQKLQAGHREYRLQPTALPQIVDDVVARMRPQAESRGQHIEMRSNGAVPDASIDREAIADAVSNLIDNAIKYSPAGTAIGVDLEADGREVRVRVTDQGIGIDPTEASRIFDPFYRSARGDQASVQGTGLGLALVKAAAEAHGGRVDVESQAGGGSRFTLRIPIAPEPDRK
jgi:signal transduction histidine kinase